MDQIAVTVLTGFLGAGKTTLLRHILHEPHGFQIAVIENEFGDIPVDDQLIGDQVTQLRTLSNGCICCTRSGELEETLLDLLHGVDNDGISFDRLIIECTGMADPGPIVQAFFTHETICQRYLLDGVITLVDAVHAPQQLDKFPVSQSQVGYADRVLLTKTDLAPAYGDLVGRLQRINARAPVLPVIQGKIDLALLFNTRGFMLEQEEVPARRDFHLIPQQQNQISSIVVECDYPVVLGEISDVMEGLLLSFADNLLRYKGMLWIAEEPRRLLFQGVQRLYSADWDREWQPTETPKSQLVFIGNNLPEAEIRQAFAALRPDRVPSADRRD